VTLAALIFTVLVVHATYVAWIRPNGDALIAAEQARMRADPNFVPERSFFLVINAPCASRSMLAALPPPGAK
jgi:hypothetical protein